MSLDRKLYNSVLIAVELRINDIKKNIPMGGGPFCQNQLADLELAAEQLRKILIIKETVYE